MDETSSDMSLNLEELKCGSIDRSRSALIDWLLLRETTDELLDGVIELFPKLKNIENIHTLNVLSQVIAQYTFPRCNNEDLLRLVSDPCGRYYCRLMQLYIPDFVLEKLIKDICDIKPPKQEFVYEMDPSTRTCDLLLNVLEMFDNELSPCTKSSTICNVQKSILDFKRMLNNFQCDTNIYFDI